MKEQIICWFAKGNSFYVLLRVDIELKGEKFKENFEIQVIGDQFNKKAILEDQRLQADGFIEKVRQNIITWLNVFETDASNKNEELIPFIKSHYSECNSNNT